MLLAPEDFKLVSDFSLSKQVFSTSGVMKESICNFKKIANRFHVMLRILSPESCKQSLRMKSNKILWNKNIVN